MMICITHIVSLPYLGHTYNEAELRESDVVIFVCSVLWWLMSYTNDMACQEEVWVIKC